jgi:DNA-directed RNA polymerase II subunit RPB1
VGSRANHARAPPQVVPVPPPQVRPSVTMGGSSERSEDDLTCALIQIIRCNKTLRDRELDGSPNHVLLNVQRLLQYHLATFITNVMPGVEPATTRSGRPLKAIAERLKGKYGRIRGNLMGKRVDFSARTVITPDPNLAIDQVGVPRSIARTLTYPEIVTPFNMERMRELVENGPLELPGARYIIRNDGMRVDLRMAHADKNLQVGYKVERHLQNGDIVMFNRQPSLHKMSIMSHRVHIVPYSTFRLNLSVTSPYNADFDGDEMNLHVMQSMETRAEAAEIMSVPRCIISPQSNKPVMGIVQDTLLGSRGFTRRDCFIAKDLLMNLVMHLDTFDGELPLPAILKPKPLWTGKQVQSLFIPKVNFFRFANGHEDEKDELSAGDTRVEVHDGELMMGMLDKKSLGTSGGSLIHIIANEYGPTGARAFIGVHQRVINHWILQRGYSIGIGDTIADASTMDDIVSTIELSKREVKSLVEKAQNNKLECQPGRTMLESFENSVNVVLNNARDTAGTRAQKSLKESNNVKNMVTTGSKGSFINISQMIACVGQQNVEGKRIPYGFLNRTLPHFTKDDYGPESRGFVENSYLRGLTPQEFFFHAMGGREGLIDTAVKTSTTGYIQRRLVKAMESVSARYDGTVRNGAGEIIQFLYGEDGMDAVWIEKQKFDLLDMSTSQMKASFSWDPDTEDTEKCSRYMEPDVATDVSRPETQVELTEEFEQLERDQTRLQEICKARAPGEEAEGSAQVPVNLARLILFAQQRFNTSANVDDIKSDLNPVEVNEMVSQLCRNLIVVKGQDELSIEAQYNATMLYTIMLRCALASKKIIKKYRLSRRGLQWLVGEIESKFLMSLVCPGEMCGVIAAQSIGEPATQMTLNTFHYAGVSAKNVTLGVPRLTEIINIAKQVKTPGMTIYLDEDYRNDQEKAGMVQAQIEFTVLKDIVKKTQIIYDPNPQSTVVEEDRAFIADYYEMPDEDVDINKMSPWVLRIELRRDMVSTKKIEMREIQNKIKEEYGTDLAVIVSDDNAEKLVMRVRIVNDDEGKVQAQDDVSVGQEDDVFLKRIESNMLEKLNLRGLAGVTKVYMRGDGKRVFWDPSGGGKFANETEWILDTDGTNLLEVLCEEHIDFTRTVSNDIVEIIQVLGVEAVRAALLNELRHVLMFDGNYVNYRHLSVLCDVMTFRGYLMAVTRHGINRQDSGPLLRCSFEETVEILFNAAAFAEGDTLKGITPNIMLGQLAPVGTGDFTLVLDETNLDRAIEPDLPDANVDNHIIPMSPDHAGNITPMQAGTPMANSPGHYGQTPAYGDFGDSAQFTPTAQSPMMSPGSSPAYSSSPAYGASPAYSGGTSPAYK